MDGSQYFHFLTSTQLNCGFVEIFRQYLHTINLVDLPSDWTILQAEPFDFPPPKLPLARKQNQFHSPLIKVYVWPLANRDTSIGSDITFKKSSP